MSSTPRDLIAKRAYQIWQQEGCPSGREEEHWLRAEQELAQPRKAAAAENRPARISQAPRKARR